MDTVTVFDCAMRPPATMVRHDRPVADTSARRFVAKSAKTPYGIPLAECDARCRYLERRSADRGRLAASTHQELPANPSRVRVRELPCPVHRRARQPDQHVETPADRPQGRSRP